MNPAANTTYTLLAPLPCLPGDPGCAANTLTNTISLNSYILYAFNLLIAIAAVAAVFMIVWGGFEYITSASFGTKSEGLKKVQNAVIGLLMVLCTYIILQTVNPNLVNIPGTLVPPINPKVYTQANSDTSGFLDQLQNQADYYQGQIQTSKADAQVQQATVASLQQQYNNLQSQIDAAPDTATAEQLSEQQDAIQNQIDAAQSAATVDTQIANFSTQVQGAVTGLTSTDNSSVHDYVLNQLQALGNTYSTAVTQLKQSSASSAQLQTLYDNYIFAATELTLTDYAKNPAPSPTTQASNLNELTTSASKISQTQDPALYSKVTSDIQAVQKATTYTH